MYFLLTLVFPDNKSNLLIPLSFFASTLSTGFNVTIVPVHSFTFNMPHFWIQTRQAWKVEITPKMPRVGNPTDKGSTWLPNLRAASDLRMHQGGWRD